MINPEHTAGDGVARLTGGSVARLQELREALDAQVANVDDGEGRDIFFELLDDLAAQERLVFDVPACTGCGRVEPLGHADWFESVVLIICAACNYIHIRPNPLHQGDQA